MSVRNFKKTPTLWVMGMMSVSLERFLEQLSFMSKSEVLMDGDSADSDDQ